YCAIPFFGLAIFCKCTLIAAPLAVFIHLALNHAWKRAIAFAAGLSFLCSLTFVVLQVATGGWFAFHMFSTHPDRYSLFQFLGLAGLVWISAPVVTGLALWNIVANIRSFGNSFASIYFVASLVTSLSAGKLGATTNHFLEWMVASCLCAGLAYFTLTSISTTRLMPITLLLSVVVLAGVVVQNWPSHQPLGDISGCGDAYSYVRNAPSSQVLSENLTALLIGGKPVVVSDPFAYSQFVKRGLWPDRKVEQLVNQQYFGLIVLRSDPSDMKRHGSNVWSEWFVDAVMKNYRVTARFDCRDTAVMLEPRQPTTGEAISPAPASLGH
ncbi:MAG TPA: hypothetical protein VF753_05510, partial [Terriglobales bacterium]